MTDRSRRFVIASREFALQRSRVESGLRDVLPEPVRDHDVVINRRRYPPKQVVGVLTGLGRAELHWSAESRLRWRDAARA